MPCPAGTGTSSPARSGSFAASGRNCAFRTPSPAREDVEGFGAAYGWDIRDWPGIAPPVAIREISGLSPYVRNAPAQPFARRDLALRISTLQAEAHFARWNRPGSATPGKP